MTKKSSSKSPVPIFKLLISFVVGFVFVYLGVIVGGLWIWRRTKHYKRLMFTVLVLGCVLNLGLGLINKLNQPRMDGLFFSRYPELKTLASDLERQYPDTEVNMGVNYHSKLTTNIKGSTSSAQTALSVTMTSSKALMEDELKEIARTVCDETTAANAKYDALIIVSNKVTRVLGVFPYTEYFRLNAVCEDAISTPTPTR